MFQPFFVPLSCIAQNYDWGKRGLDSSVARLYAKQQRNNHAAVDELKPYAELWMGTHPNGASRVTINRSNGSEEVEEILLSEFLKSQPALIYGEKVLQKLSKDYDFANGQLPFLFKVLSIQKALSIQAHPHRELAQRLHRSDPKNYRDPNHKPEIACALTHFEALCCFRPLEEIARFIHAIPELQTVIGDEAYSALKQQEELLAADPNANKQARKTLLKSLYTSLMNADASLVTEQLSLLVERLRNPTETTNCASQRAAESLLLRLNDDFPGDIGCLSVFFLNYIQMEPFHALFLAPDEPHAYISGECIECMADSDNVVRAGLTPKFKDVAVLCDMLTYDDSNFEKHYYNPVPTDGNTNNVLYSPPVEEFQVRIVTLEPGQSTTVCTDSISIALVFSDSAPTDGNGADAPHCSWRYKGVEMFREQRPENVSSADIERLSQYPQSGHNGDFTEGSCFVVAAHTELSIASNGRKLVVFVASCNDKLLAQQLEQAN